MDKRENRIERQRQKLNLQPLPHKVVNPLKNQMSSPNLIARPKSLAHSLQEQSYQKSNIVTHQPDAGSPKPRQRDEGYPSKKNPESAEENITNWKLPSQKQDQQLEAAGARKPPKSALKSNPSIPAPVEAQQSALEHLQQLRVAEHQAQRLGKQQITEKPNKMRYL